MQSSSNEYENENGSNKNSSSSNTHHIVPVGLKENRAIFNQYGILNIDGIGLDNDCVGSNEDDEIESAALARNELNNGRRSNGSSDDDLDQDSMLELQNKLNRKARTIDVSKLPILLRAQINDRNVQHRPWSSTTPYQVLSIVIDIYFDYVKELTQTRRNKRLQQQQQQQQQHGNSMNSIDGVAATVPDVSSSSSTSSTSTGPAGLGLAPAPLLSYVLKRFERTMNGVSFFSGMTI